MFRRSSASARTIPAPQHRLHRCSCPLRHFAEGVVNIYSYREPKLIEPLLQAFTAKTGIATNVVFANTGLIERLADRRPQQPG